MHFLPDSGGLGRWTSRLAGRLPSVLFLLGLLMFSAFPANAQIELQLSLEARSYMVGEAFAARVRIRNGLDVPLVFDDDYRNAELFVELIPDNSVGESASDRKAISRQTVIMPEGEQLELVEITSLFNVTQPGGHRLRIGIRHEGSLYLSASVGFDLVEGIELLSVRRGLSGYKDIDLEYSLRYWRRAGGEQAFFLIRNKADGSLYGTFGLGPVVRVNPPAIRFDSQGRAVVVHQSGRNRFTRSVVAVDPTGALLVEQTHHLEDGRPYPVLGVPKRDGGLPEQKGQE